MEKIFGGRYQIEEKIGAGGMAIVYRAKDMLLNRTVAIKVLREQFASDEGFIRRFRREAQSAASLSHHNIVSIYDVGKDDNNEYIVMEYVKGQTLKDLIRTHAPLSQEQAIHIVRQIAEALKHAHINNIIHRDIKPQNILVTADGRAKVTDFGIARAASASTLTHTGDIVGSVHYLSPEQAKGAPTTAQSDIYSLGIILYELIAGKLPYDGDTPITIALKHIQEEVELPGKLVPGVSPELETVIMKALAKSPEDRYKNAVDFLEDLHKVEAGETIVWEKGSLNEKRDTMQTQVHKGLREKVVSGEKKDNKALLKNKKFYQKIPMPVLAVLILVVIVSVVLGMWIFTHSKSVPVPDLTGMTQEEARTELAKVRLSLGDVDYAFSDNETDKDKVINQEYKPKQEVKAGRKIGVTISKGVEYLVMPDVTIGNPTLDDAIAKILAVGFLREQIEVKETTSAIVPEGKVFGQSPAQGSTWAKISTSKIELYVSSGIIQSLTVMPDVRNYSSDLATKILKEFKLIVIPQTETSYDFPEGAVIRTNPAPGQPVHQGSEVTIYVSLGPGPAA
ncbi:Stk1 family PASTA domain-containing Ser/Thr kinase [Dehalobacter sp. DCM]|uniref:Stk1 family PASTA domain-containing Ser/Thr kinase n=1 Tax=Dehalobacter sp. DCM TaxID=2907827 RepID=UPI0030819C8A|nr:Stk1 family PASTA domain-containing Ser/Thr kinase [Dehalobacter sp. DCM]